MTTKMQSDIGLPAPKQGETFRCAVCGMEIKVTKDCQCKSGEHVHFHCCGQELVKA